MDELDVWWLHERNSRYYYTCKDVNKCPNALSFSEDGDDKQCLCHNDQIVVPQQIGEWWQPADIKVRSYIPIGADCPICLSPIRQKRNAWITFCGHGFHRTCLMQSYNIYMNNKNIIHYTNCMPCPICRSMLPTCCCGFEITRYHQIYGEPRNELDVLEEFTQTCDLLIPMECLRCKEYLGMKKNCDKCSKYRLYGDKY